MQIVDYLRIYEFSNLNFSYLKQNIDYINFSRSKLPYQVHVKIAKN